MLIWQLQVLSRWNNWKVVWVRDNFQQIRIFFWMLYFIDRRKKSWVNVTYCHLNSETYIKAGEKLLGNLRGHPTQSHSQYFSIRTNREEYLKPWAPMKILDTCVGLSCFVCEVYLVYINLKCPGPKKTLRASLLTSLSGKSPPHTMSELELFWRMCKAMTMHSSR